MLCVICGRLGEFISNKHNVDDDDAVIGLSSAAKCQHFCRCQRTPSTVLIKSSGQLALHIIIIIIITIVFH